MSNTVAKKSFGFYVTIVAVVISIAAGMAKGAKYLEKDTRVYALLGDGGCLNFFAGPIKTDFSAKFNFYDVHYAFHRITGTSGGNTSDLKEALKLAGEGKINPSIMISHVGGLDSVVDTTLNLPNIKGAKKLVYTHISMPMTAIADFEELGKTDKFFKDLADICKKNNGIWSDEAEKYLLANAKKI